jgi:hypothetical protein
VPNFNKKGAFGQAKFAKAMGSKARYSADTGAKGQAAVPFDTGQAGAGEIGTPAAGAGLGGAGVSSGEGLKGSDASLSNNESTPPAPAAATEEEAEDVSPWKSLADTAMNGMMIAFGCLLVTKVLGKFAKTNPYILYVAMAVAAIGALFAARVMFAGMKIMTTYGQKMMGGIYMAAGAMLVIQLWNAAAGVASSATTVGDGATDASKAFANSNSWATDFGKMGIENLFK